MKIFDLDSPFMQIMNKMADLLLLNILTVLCCIPIITIGPSLTAMHYVALKIVRGEETYIAKDFFKSFKINFKQGILIWLLFLISGSILVSDIYIMLNSGIELNKFLVIAIMAVCVVIVFTFMFVFPMLSKFDNSTWLILKNAFITSILQFPKTFAMIILYLLPVVLFIFVTSSVPVIFCFGLSMPAYLSAMMYNKFFKKLEDMIEAGKGSKVPEELLQEDDRIFKDEIDESLFDAENAGVPFEK